MKKLIMVPVVVLVAALALPGAAYADEAEQGQVVFGGTFTLESGDELNGDLVIFGGSVELEQDSVVDGDVLLFGGNAEIYGEIRGDLALLGGNANLGSSAVITGDVATLGGNVHRAEGAVVEGDFISSDGVAFPFSFDLPNIPNFRDSVRVQPFGGGSIGPFFSPVTSILWFVFRSLLIAALAVLVVLFWPQPTRRTGSAAVAQPIVSGGLGCLTFIVVPILSVLLTITIIGLPLAFLALIALVVAVVFGWIAVGMEVGRRLTEAFNWELHPAASAGIGTLAVSFVVGGIGFIPCIGGLAPLLVGAAGLGAVILTRFGSREYELATASAELPAPKSRKAPAKKSSAKKK